MLARGTGQKLGHNIAARAAARETHQFHCNLASGLVGSLHRAITRIDDEKCGGNREQPLGQTRSQNGILNPNQRFMCLQVPVALITIT